MSNYKNPCTLNEINTTDGKKWLVVTYSRSKDFKTLQGAKKWIEKNNYRIVKKLNLD